MLQVRLSPTVTEIMIKILESAPAEVLTDAEREEAAELAARLRYRYARAWGPLALPYPWRPSPPARRAHAAPITRQAPPGAEETPLWQAGAARKVRPSRLARTEANAWSRSRGIELPYPETDESE